jgi:hypothetical protein
MVVHETLAIYSVSKINRISATQAANNQVNDDILPHKTEAR